MNTTLQTLTLQQNNCQYVFQQTLQFYSLLLGKCVPVCLLSVQESSTGKGWDFYVSKK